MLFVSDDCASLLEDNIYIVGEVEEEKKRGRRRRERRIQRKWTLGGMKYWG